MAVVKDEMKDNSEAEEPADTEKEQSKIQNETLKNDEENSDSKKTARTGTEEEGKDDEENVEETKDKAEEKQENTEDSVANLDDIDEEMDIDNENDNDEEEVEDEEDEEDMEMPDEDKAALVEAVRTSDYLTLQDLWDKRTTDINMTWFNENLLMVAIRERNEEMAEFLIDNGVDPNFESVIFDLKENTKDKIVLGKRVDCYKRSCRQVAFDCEMDKIVEMIDIKNSNWFPFVKPIPRKPKYRRPPAPPIPEKWQPVVEEEEEEEEEETTENTNTTNKNEVVIKTDDDGDSGHQSLKDGELSMFSDVYKRGDMYDEGYRTVSNSPYLSPPKEERPIFITKPTKSSMLLYSHTSEIRKRRGNAKSAPEKRRLDVVGSYSRESRMWHLPRRKDGSASAASASTATRVQSSVITHGSAPAVMKTDPYRQKNANLLNKRQTPLSQVSKILGESRLLSSQSELGLPYIHSTHNVCQKNKTTRILYGNSSVSYRVKDAQFQTRMTHPKFMINSALYDRNTMKHGQIK